jgi:hypothetical protein
VNVWPHGDPRDVARAIVSDPRYTGITAAKRPAATPWERFVQWIGEQLDHFFRVVGHALGSENPWTRVVGFLTIAAAIGAVAYLVFRLVSSYRALPPVGRSRTASVALGDHARTSRDLRAAAAAAATAGRFREAAGLYLLAAMRLLDERGTIAFDAARTAGEYRRLVREPNFDRLARGAVVALFDDAEPDATLIADLARSFETFAEPALR